MSKMRAVLKMAPEEQAQPRLSGPRKRSVQTFYSNKRSKGGASLVDVTIVDAVVTSIIREYVDADRVTDAIEAINKKLGRPILGSRDASLHKYELWQPSKPLVMRLLLRKLRDGDRPIVVEDERGVIKWVARSAIEAAMAQPGPELDEALGELQPGQREDPTRMRSALAYALTDGIDIVRRRAIALQGDEEGRTTIVAALTSDTFANCPAARGTGVVATPEGVPFVKRALADVMGRVERVVAARGGGDGDSSWAAVRRELGVSAE